MCLLEERKKEKEEKCSQLLLVFLKVWGVGGEERIVQLKMQIIH